MFHFFGASTSTQTRLTFAVKLRTTWVNIIAFPLLPQIVLVKSPRRLASVRSFEVSAARQGDARWSDFFAPSNCSNSAAQLPFRDDWVDKETILALHLSRKKRRTWVGLSVRLALRLSVALTIPQMDSKTFWLPEALSSALTKIIFSVIFASVHIFLAGFSFSRYALLRAISRSDIFIVDDTTAARAVHPSIVRLHRLARTNFPGPHDS